jgi:ribosomal protein S18 acetylase RimI-like enzyme
MSQLTAEVRAPMIIEAVGCAGRRLVARLAARSSQESLAARFFLPASRRVGRPLLELLPGPAEGRAYLAMDDGRPVGLVNVVPDGRREVEIAVLVADRWQHRGIGRALLEHALADPRWAGQTVHAAVRPDNIAVLTLLRSLGRPMRLVDHAPGEYHFELGTQADTQAEAPRLAG